MDKNDALKISKTYINKLKNSTIDFSEAWMFGSYAKGNQNEYSDIDIAIVLKDGINHSFDTDVQLMILRSGEETIIEPHAFPRDEFTRDSPIVNQIIQFGIRLEI